VIINEKQASGLTATALLVGGVLIVLTVGSYWLGTDHLLGFSRLAMAVVLLIAFLKVWLVTHFFMDMWHSPRWLKAIIYGWVFITGTLVLGLYIAR